MGELEEGGESPEIEKALPVAPLELSSVRPGASSRGSLAESEIWHVRRSACLNCSIINKNLQGSGAPL